MRKKLVTEKKKTDDLVKSFADVFIPSSSIYNSNDVFGDKKLGQLCRTFCQLPIKTPIVTHNSISSIKSSTTDLCTAETRPLDERDDLPLAANEGFPSLNPASTAPEAFEARLSVQHDETPSLGPAPQ